MIEAHSHDLVSVAISPNSKKEKLQKCVYFMSSFLYVAGITAVMQGVAAVWQLNSLAHPKLH